MKFWLVLGVTILVGCATTGQGSAKGLETTFREQLAENRLVKEYGYRIDDVRFSKTGEKALVILNHSDPKARPHIELILKKDDFERYQGSTILPFATPSTSTLTSVIVSVDTAKRK